MAMIGSTRVEHVAGVRSKALACGVKTTSPVLGAGAVVLMLFSASAAQAQCTSGVNTGSAVVNQAAGMAVENVSASVGALVTSINSVNTAFLTQSSAFIGSPGNPQPDQEGGGVWARGVGGHLSASTTATAGNISFGGALPGTITCNTRTLEDFAGVQIGTDFARLNVNGWNLHAGSTIGYLGSKTHDATPGLIRPRVFATAFRSRSWALTPRQVTGVFSSMGKFAGIFSKTRSLTTTMDCRLSVSAHAASA
jgi:hypothetical protein